MCLNETYPVKTRLGSCMLMKNMVIFTGTYVLVELNNNIKRWLL